MSEWIQMNIERLRELGRTKGGVQGYLVGLEKQLQSTGSIDF